MKISRFFTKSGSDPLAGIPFAARTSRITKLDGSAKGGVVVPILERLKLPIAFVGVGEKLDDLIPFDPEAFVDGLLDV